MQIERQLVIFPVSFFLLCFPFQVLLAQFEKVLEFETHGSQFTTDKNGDIYLIEDHQLVKVRHSDKARFAFRLRKYERNAIFDVSDPEHVILFIPQAGKVYVLDSLLSPFYSPFYLDQLGLYGINSVIYAGDSSLWLYHTTEKSLVKLNRFFIPLKKTALTEFLGIAGSPNYFTSYASNVYINVPSTGIIVVNSRGEYETLYRIKGLVDFQVTEDGIIFFRDNSLYLFNVDNFNITEMNMPEIDGIQNVRVYKNLFVVRTADEISIYRE